MNNFIQTPALKHVDKQLTTVTYKTYVWKNYKEKKLRNVKQSITNIKYIY